MMKAAGAVCALFTALAAQAQTAGGPASEPRAARPSGDEIGTARTDGARRAHPGCRLQPGQPVARHRRRGPDDPSMASRRTRRSAGRAARARGFCAPPRLQPRRTLAYDGKPSARRCRAPPDRASAAAPPRPRRTIPTGQIRHGSSPYGVRGPPSRYSAMLGGPNRPPTPASHRRTKAAPVLQTLMLPRVTAEYQAGKLATTETRQPFSSGSFRVTLVFDASGPERATAFLPTRTATAVAGMARPFTTISVAAERRFCGRAAEEAVGAGAVDAGGAAVGAPAGSGAGAVSAERSP
jgi:hypothetical protein